MKPYYEENGITIYNADCREVLPSLPKADLLLTDPPYRQSNSGAGLVGRRSTYNEIRANLSTFDPAFLCSALSTVCKSPHGYIFSAKDTVPDYCEFMRSQGWGWDVLVYAKDNPLPAKNNKYLSDIEFVIFYRAPSVCFFNNELPYRHYFKVKRTTCAPSVFGHPTEKDVDILNSMIQVSTKANELIIDPYMGSGTTLRAAKDLGRRAIGIDIEEKYCEMAALRMGQQMLAFEPPASALSGDRERTLEQSGVLT